MLKRFEINISYRCGPTCPIRNVNLTMLAGSSGDALESAHTAIAKACKGDTIMILRSVAKLVETKAAQPA